MGAYMASKWNVGDCLPDLTHDERRWEIKKVLGGTGKSGMGVVYVVYDRAWKKTFAAKTFQDEAFARSPQVAKRFIQEAHTWINLGSHPNVTQAHFIYRIPSQPPHFTGNYAWLERVEARPFLFLE